MATTIEVHPYKYDPSKWQANLMGHYADGVPFRKRPVVPEAKNKNEAKKWAAAEFTRLSTRNSPKAKTETPASTYTFGDLWKDYLDNQKTCEDPVKESTLDTYKYQWGPHLSELATLAVTEYDATFHQKFQAKMRAKKSLKRDKLLSAKTVNEVFNLLRVLLGFAVELKIIPTMPVTIKPRKVEDRRAVFYSFDELDQLLNAAKDNPIEYAAVMLMAKAGLRSGEVSALRLQDLDFESKTIWVAQRDYNGKIASPKGGRGEPVAMSPDLEKALRAVKGHLRGPLVLYAEDGRSYTHCMLQYMMMRLQEKAGLEVTGHQHILRHTFCSHLAMLGVDISTIKKLARHRDIETTERYMHLSPDHVTRAVAKLSEPRLSVVR